MNKLLEALLALAIVGATLAFGGVQTITYSLMEIVLFALLLALLLKQAREGEIRLPLPLWPVLFLLVVVVQVIPLPSGLVETLSPARAADLRTVTQGAWATLSVYPRDTTLSLVKVLAYLSAFVLAAHLFDSRQGLSTLLRALILLGCFEAGYGIVQYLTGWQKIFTYTKKSGLGEASGTFINRNHFAGFLELVLPFVLASAFYSFQVWAGRRGSFGMRRATGDRSSGIHQFLFYLFLLIVMVVAVIFSRSRAGILATLFTIILMAALAQLRTGSKAWLLGVLAFFGSVLGYGLWIGLGPVLARFEGIGEPGYLQIEGRFAIWKDTLRLIHDFPLTGSGLGTFDLVFRQYQTTSVNFLVDHAHNDFLEFASDTGLPGASLLFLPILYLLGRMALSFLDDPHSYRRAVTLGCIGSTTALLLHSVTDFNLQIPSNALVFAVVLGIGYKVTCLDRGAEAQTESPPYTPRG